MHTDLNLGTTHLPRGQLLRIENARGSLVLCLSGTLWLTQQDDHRDIVLEAGDETLIERDGLSILTALSDARYMLSQDSTPIEPLRQILRTRPAWAAF